MNIPTLHNLTQTQVKLLNMIWLCDTQEQLLNLRRTLSYDNQREMDVLMTILILTGIDDEVMNTEPRMAVDMLKRIGAM